MTAPDHDDVHGIGWRNGRLGFARARPHATAFLAATLLTVPCILWIDRPVARLVADHVTYEQRRLMDTLVLVADATPYLVGLAVLMVVLGLALRRDLGAWGRRVVERTFNAAGYLFGSIVLTGLGGIAIKTILGRIRPRDFIDGGVYGFSPFNIDDFAMNSLPSGHTQFMFTLAMALSVVYPPGRALYFLVAFAVGVMRVLQGVHYVGDVVFGIYVGVIGPLLIRQHFLDRRAIAVRLPPDD